jgi:nickel transport protein
MKRPALLQLLCTLILIPVLCRPGLAHKVRIFAWQDGESIVTESMFSHGKPAQNATVAVFEPETGKNLLSGTTDTQGIFSFPIPATRSTALTITVDGGDGHKNSWNFTLAAPAPVVDDAPSLRSETGVATSVRKQPAVEGIAEKSLPPISAGELTRIIETTLDKKLAPINRTLAESSEKGPTLQDILGGIGYILGLAGIAAYLQSRKNHKE